MLSSFAAANTSADLDLAPELASIAKRVEAHAPPLPRTTSGPYSRSTSVDPAGADTVQLTVRWTPHPHEPARPAQGWRLSLRRTDNFARVAAAVADLAGVRAGDLVLAHAGRRVFAASATPAALGIWAAGELDASTSATFEFLREERARARSASVQPEAPADDEIEFTGSAKTPRGGSPAPAPEPAEAGEAKFRLVVRAAGAKELAINVRRSTTCGTIVRAFVKAAGLSVAPAVAAKARVVVDGERMDPDAEIGEADLEEGDMVEIAGL
jgi:hypothetical protein